jgi:plastocyanin
VKYARGRGIVAPMSRLLAVLVLPMMGLAFSGGARAAGSITGTVKVTGKLPEPKAIDPKSDPYCVKQKTLRDEEIIAGPGGQLSNVVVRIAKGLHAAAHAPGTNAVVEQSGCRYVPHVLVVQAGQQVEIRNGDQTFHNIHTYRGQSSLFNLPQVQGMPPYFKTFPKAGDVIKLKCDIHKWMSAYVLVVGDSHFAVTGEDGRFTLPELPAGKYTVEIWHERLGSKTVAVTVADGKPAELNVELPAK